MKITHTYLLAAVTITFGGTFTGAHAQLNNRSRNQVGRPAPKNFVAELKTVIADYAKGAKVRIVVDPSIFVSTSPKPLDNKLDVSKTLDLVVSNVKNSVWKKVYLRENSPVPAADKLAASLRAIDSITHDGLVVETPGSIKATTFVKDFEMTKDFAEDLSASKFSAGAVYVLYAISIDKRSISDQYADLQRRSYEMMSQLSPDELAQSMQAGLDMFSSLDPGTRQQMMGTMMKAGMQMFMNMPQDQRNSLLQGFGPGFPGGGGKP